MPRSSRSRRDVVCGPAVDVDGALAAVDPRVAAAVARYGPSPANGDRVRRRVTPFEDLARAICFQQLAGAAASAIHARFVARFEGRPTPEAVIACPVEELRAVGLSASKAASIRDLAQHLVDGSLDLARLGRRSDDEIVADLVQVRGIGRWTAEMFLIRLGRPDVWPVDDYGVRKGSARLFELAELPTPRELGTLGEPFRPYRSTLAWYCWRVADEG